MWMIVLGFLLCSEFMIFWLSGLASQLLLCHCFPLHLLRGSVCMFFISLLISLILCWVLNLEFLPSLEFLSLILFRVLNLEFLECVYIYVSAEKASHGEKTQVMERCDCLWVSICFLLCSMLWNHLYCIDLLFIFFIEILYIATFHT